MIKRKDLSGEDFTSLLKFSRKDFLTYCQLIDPKYEATWFHERIAGIAEKILTNLKNGRKSRIILAIPPRCGKTYTASILFPTWAMGRRPDLKFILSTYGADLSEKIGAQTRDILTSKEYSYIFPRTKLREDTQSKSHFMTSEKGAYTAVGLGGAVTGTGADIIIVDDLIKSREEAESPSYQRQAWDYYRSTLYSRLEGYGAVVVIMQRWNQNDLVARLLEEEAKLKESGEEYDDWEVITFPAIAVEDEYGVDGEIIRKEGEPLWESKFPVPILNNIKNNVGAIAWNSQYQQNPIAAEDQEFKEEMFRQYDADEIKDKQFMYYTVCDPAISQKREADNTVVLTIAKERNSPNIYRVKETAGHFTPSQTMDIIFQHQEEFRSDVYIETVAYQQALKYAVEEEQMKRGKYFVVKEVKTRTNKDVRIRGLLPLYERGVIYHKHTDKPYEDELITFPRGRRDDRCPIGDTLIDTSTGYIPIRDVKKGDYVLTRLGYKKVLESGKTGHEKVITRLGITATPDHPVYTEKGWISLADVRESDTIIVCKKQLLGMGLSSEDIQNLNTETTGFITKEELKGEFHIYTEKFGKKKMGKFLKDFMFTTLIITPSIIVSKIYNALVMSNTTKFTKTSGSTKVNQKNGMSRKKVSSGEKTNQGEQKRKQHSYTPVLSVIKNSRISKILHLFTVGLFAKLNIKKNYTNKKSEKPEKQKSRRTINSLSVKTAESLLEIVHGENTKSVKNAKKKGDISLDTHQGLESSEKNNVTSAVRLLKVTVRDLDSVLKNVPTNGRCLDKESVEDVYNLKVEDANEYFANGVLIHNCDAMAIAVNMVDNTVDDTEHRQYIPKWLGYGRKAK